MSTTRRSRVPEVKSITDEPEHYAFLDAVDKRHQRFAELEDLATSPTVEELAAKINAMLQTHRIK